jgi:hypothetical protein
MKMKKKIRKTLKLLNILNIYTVKSKGDFSVAFEDKDIITLKYPSKKYLNDWDVKLFEGFRVEYLKKMFNNHKVPMISSNLSAILHEIGHIETYNSENEENYTIQSNNLKELYLNNKINTKEYMDAYSEIKEEKEANLWMLHFCKDHPQLIETLAKLWD